MARASERHADSSDFASNFASAATALELAVRDLLKSGWNEPERRHAHEIAHALMEGAKVACWKETGGVLQALTSLLALPLDEVLSISEALRTRLLELLALLRDMPASESA